MRSRRSKEPLSFGDRAVTAFIAGVCGFATMAILWVWALSWEVTVPFFWTWIGGGVIAAFGFVLGPGRIMNVLEHLWWGLGTLLGGSSEQPSDRFKRRRRF